jgi:hypothetical protein
LTIFRPTIIDPKGDWFIYSNIENLVLWARSEAVGYAVKRADKKTEFRIR